MQSDNNGGGGGGGSSIYNGIARLDNKMRDSRQKMAHNNAIIAANKEEIMFIDREIALIQPKLRSLEEAMAFRIETRDRLKAQLESFKKQIQDVMRDSKNHVKRTTNKTRKLTAADACYTLEQTRGFSSKANLSKK